MSLTGAAGSTDTVRLNGSDLEVTIDGTTSARPITSVTSLSISGSAGPDTLSVDASVADAGIPISFDGADGADSVRGPAVDSTWAVTGAGAGSVGGVAFSGAEDLIGAAGNEDTFVFEATGSLAGTVEGGDGGYDVIVVATGGAPLASSITGPQSGTLTGADVITYAGMEPVTIVGTTAIVITAPANATIVIAESGTLTDKTFSINLNGAGETHFITAADTVTSIILNLGAGTNLVTVKALDPAFTGSLTINGGAGDDSVVLVEKTGPGAYSSTAAPVTTRSRGRTSIPAGRSRARARAPLTSPRSAASRASSAAARATHSRSPRAVR